MDIDRRQFLLAMAGGLMTIGCIEALPEEEHWRGECRRWLDLLLPEVKKADPIQTPIWDGLEELMLDDRFSHGLKKGFNQLKKSYSAGEISINEVLSTGGAEAIFLSAFYDVALELLYGSPIGWSDIGIHTPPQPTGYSLIGIS